MKNKLGILRKIVVSVCVVVLCFGVWGLQAFAEDAFVITAADGDTAVRTGRSLQLTVSGGVGPYRWESSDARVARMSTVTLGLVRGLTEGTVTITCTDSEGQTATYELLVSSSALELADTAATLGVSANPQVGKVATLTITSTKLARKTVLVTGAGEPEEIRLDYYGVGTKSWTPTEAATGAAITVDFAGDSDYQAKTFSAAYNVAKGEAYFSSDNNQVDGGEVRGDQPLYLMLDPAVYDGEKYGPLRFTSNNTEVATVNETTGQVTFVGTGETSFTITSTGSANYEASACTYTVRATQVDIDPGIVAKDQTVEYTTGGFVLAAPQGYSENYGVLTYYSENPEIAEVDEATGAVVAHATGAVQITMKSAGTWLYRPREWDFTLTVTPARLSVALTQVYDGTNRIVIGQGYAGTISHVDGRELPDAISLALDAPSLARHSIGSVVSQVGEPVPVVFNLNASPFVLEGDKADCYQVVQATFALLPRQIEIDTSKIRIERRYDGGLDINPATDILFSQGVLANYPEAETAEGLVLVAPPDLTFSAPGNPEQDEKADVLYGEGSFTLGGTKTTNYILADGRPALNQGTIYTWGGDLHDFTQTPTLVETEYYTISAPNKAGWHSARVENELRVEPKPGYLLLDVNDETYIQEYALTLSPSGSKQSTAFRVKDQATGSVSAAVQFHYQYDDVLPQGDVEVSVTTQGTPRGSSFEWQAGTPGQVTDQKVIVWNNSEITISVAGSDAHSGIDTRKVIALDADTLQQADVSLFDQPGVSDSVTVAAQENKFIYARFMDKAGNATYTSLNGTVMVDTLAPDIMHLKVSGQKSAAGVFTGDIRLDFSVLDTEGKVNAGVQSIAMQLYDNGIPYGEARTVYQNPQADVLVLGGEEQTVDYVVDTTADQPARFGTYYPDALTYKAADFNGALLTVRLEVVDTAGNGRSYTMPAEQAFAVDTQPPEATLSYDNNTVYNEHYFNASRTASVTVYDTTLSEGAGIVVNGTRHPFTAGGYDHATHRYVYTAAIPFEEDGKYEITPNIVDDARNSLNRETVSTDSAAPWMFIVDKAAPTINVQYDNNNAVNGHYYNAARTATVTIEEANFSGDQVAVQVAATLEGAEITAPAVSGWSSAGNTHTATIAYQADGDYTFDIAYTDLANNSAEAFTRHSFTVDTTAPQITFAGVEEGRAYNDQVAPRIEMTDINFDDSISMELIGVKSGASGQKSNRLPVGKGLTIAFEDFTREAATDDIYTLMATAQDKAGNTTSESITFLVNRFGSVYYWDDTAKVLNGTYAQQEQQLVLTEVNVTALDESQTVLKISKDGVITELEPGAEYTMQHQGQEMEWHTYTYTLPAENFAQEGVYRVTAQSRDGAGNVSDSAAEEKGASLGFGIDKSAPLVVVTGIETDGDYNVDAQSVSMNITDNLKLSSIAVQVDNEVLASWNDSEVEALAEEGGNFTFRLPAAPIRQNIAITCTDAAGNVSTMEVTGVLVTTSSWVRYYETKPLFYGSIAGVVLLAILVAVLIARRRRRQ